MEGQWKPEPNTPDGMKLIFKAFSRHYEELERRSQTMSTLGLWFNSTFFNRARNQQTNLHNIHYDLGNDLYEAMLDKPFMSYTWCVRKAGAARPHADRYPRVIIPALPPRPYPTLPPSLPAPSGSSTRGRLKKRRKTSLRCSLRN